MRHFDRKASARVRLRSFSARHKTRQGVQLDEMAGATARHPFDDLSTFASAFCDRHATLVLCPFKALGEYSLRPFFVLVLTSCIFAGSTRSGPCFQGVKSPETQATPEEVRPEGCQSVSHWFAKRPCDERPVERLAKYCRKPHRAFSAQQHITGLNLLVYA